MATDTSAARQGRLRAVIVEDEALIAMDLEMLLCDLDVDVMGTAPSAAGACALVRQYQPDFVTMDISLKGDRDGISAAQEIYDTYRIRVIFISSYSDPMTKDRAASCNPIAWVRKPIAPPDLAAAITQVVRSSDPDEPSSVS